MTTEGIGMKEFEFVFDGFKLVDPSHLCMSFDMVVHALMSMHFFKGENLLFLECQSRSAHVFILKSSGYCPSIVKLSFP